MKNHKIKLLGISGVAFCGKDSLYKELEKILGFQGIETRRLALADELKIELNDFIRKNYGISAFTNDPDEKSIIRNLMVAHGAIKRKQSNGKYFTNILNRKIEECIFDNILPIITDVRFAEYQDDELSWIKSNNGKVIHLKRISPDGSLIKAANSTEEQNDPKIESAADFKLVWPTTDNLIVREDYVRIQLKDLISQIIDEK